MFLSQAVVKSFVSLFFSADRGSLGKMMNTKHMFNPIKLELIILVATMICHAINEFRYGSRKIDKWED